MAENIRKGKNTRRLYYEDAYIKEFEAKAEACFLDKDGFWIMLDQTAFYPEGGGQPCDTGTFSVCEFGEIRQIQVHDVQEKDGRVLHFCKEKIEEGARVCGRIDWQRRLTHMREHSGEHIISGIICRRYGYSNIGFHMGKDFITIDFSGLLTEEEIAAAEKAANEKIMENAEIQAEYPDADMLENMDYRSKKEVKGAIRIVTIPGADCCACCGTHVKRTGEIGPVKVIGSEHYKSGIRLTLLVGEKALADYAVKSENVRKISALLSVKPEDTVCGVERLLDAMENLKQKYGSLKMQFLGQKVEAIEEGQKATVLFEKDLSPLDMRKLADNLHKKAKFAAVFCGDDMTDYRYVMICNDMDIVDFGKTFQAALGGRGGGRNPMIQGSTSASRTQIEAFLEKSGYLDF